MVDEEAVVRAGGSGPARREPGAEIYIPEEVRKREAASPNQSNYALSGICMANTISLPHLYETQINAHKFSAALRRQIDTI